MAKAKRKTLETITTLPEEAWHQAPAILEYTLNTTIEQGVERHVELKLPVAIVVLSCDKQDPKAVHVLCRTLEGYSFDELLAALPDEYLNPVIMKSFEIDNMAFWENGLKVADIWLEGDKVNWGSKPNSL